MIKNTVKHMELEGQISILINQDYTTIEVSDVLSITKFLTIRLTPEQLSMALSRLSHTPCMLNVRGLDKVGKRHEWKRHEFEIPSGVNSRYGEESLFEIAQRTAPEGWVADKYFGAQTSFFTRDGKSYARCIIRRWLES